MVEEPIDRFDLARECLLSWDRTSCSLHLRLFNLALKCSFSFLNELRMRLIDFFFSVDSAWMVAFSFPKGYYRRLVVFLSSFTDL